MSAFMQYIFGLLNDISFLIIMALISLNLPGLAQSIQVMMLDFIYLDVLQTDLWLNPMLFTQTELDEEALSLFFDQNGFSSCIFIVNLGSSFVYLLIYAFILALLFLLRLTRLISCEKIICLKSFSDWLEGKILWNSVFRLLIQQYPPILISALINIY
jgi:hypothetical protein